MSKKSKKSKRKEKRKQASEEEENDKSQSDVKDVVDDKNTDTTTADNEPVTKKARSSSESEEINNIDNKEKGDENKKEKVAVVEEPVDINEKPNFYSKEYFTNLPLCEKTQIALQKMKFTRMTQIQALSIPHLLSGKDLIGAAKTGSGKTLAFILPCIDILYKSKYTTKNGTGTIVIAPTRELAMQIYGVLNELMIEGQHTQTYGLIMGGANRKTEADKLIKGVNIIIATPGRLLDHLQNTKCFIYRNLVTLVMDEADRILEQGFEDDLRAILKLLPKERQTILFSATQTKKVQDLARVSINPKNSIFVDIPNETNEVTVAGLEQGYVTCPSDKRFLLLFTFLKKNKNKKKIMVFFSSCNSVKYHSELLNYIDIPVMDIHGKQKQIKRTTTFFTFCKVKTGILLCTDVAARGLDIPDVDWIIQFDPPDDPKEYIHRVGRTARGATGSGRALLFLIPEEIGFLKYLKATNIKLNEYEFPKVANIQNQLYKLIDSNYYLNKTARDAYRSYLLSYASHSLRNIFNVHELDLQKVGVAFGFTSPPRVDLLLSSFGNNNNNSKGRKNNKNNNKNNNKKGSSYSSTGHAFSASNPYGKRDVNDKRQFTH